MKILVLLLAYFSIATAKATEGCSGIGYEPIKGTRASDVVAQVILTKKYKARDGYREYDAEAQLFYRPEDEESFDSRIKIPRRCKVTIGVRYIVGCTLGNTCNYVVPFTPRRQPRAKNTKASSSLD